MQCGTATSRFALNQFLRSVKSVSADEPVRCPEIMRMEPPICSRHATRIDAPCAARICTTRPVSRLGRLSTRVSPCKAPQLRAAVDPLEEASPAVAGIIGASVQGRTALDTCAGTRVLHLGRHPDAPWVTSTGARQAHLDHFDLHANIAVRGRDGERVERPSHEAVCGSGTADQYAER